MDISGKWIYNEDFEFGKSEGEVDFIQAGNEVIGRFAFSEKVPNVYDIEVTEKVRGTIGGGKLVLESIETIAMQNNVVVDYCPNIYDVHLVTENKLVGSTFDSEAICGVFVLVRKY